MAANLDALDRADEAEKHLDALIKQHPDDLEAIMALGNILRGHKKFAECADVYSKGVATIAQAGKGELGDLLFPRHLLRALEAVAEGGSRSQEGARAVPRAAARAQLSRLFLDRPGHQPRRGHGHDQARRAAAAGRRLHRRLARLGLLPASAITRKRSSSSSARSSSSRKTRPSTIISATPIGAIGRELEAKFQWAHARDLKPDPEELPKIEEKLKNGLPDETSSQAKAGKKSGDGG